MYFHCIFGFIFSKGTAIILDWQHDDVIMLIKKARTAGYLLHVIGREAMLLVQLGEEWVPSDAHRAAEANDERWSLASSRRHHRWWSMAAMKLKGDRLKIDGTDVCFLYAELRKTEGPLTASTAAATGELAAAKRCWDHRQKHRRWKKNVQTMIDRCKERLRCRERWDKPHDNDPHQRHSRWLEKLAEEIVNVNRRCQEKRKF